MMKVLIVSKLSEIEEQRRRVEELMIALNQQFDQTDSKTLVEFMDNYKEELFLPMLELYLKEYELSLLKENCTDVFLKQLKQANIAI